MRETLDFAARCQGAGNKPAELRQLLDLEAKAGISPDPSTDAFMKARAPRPPLRCLPSSPEQRVPSLCRGAAYPSCSPPLLCDSTGTGAIKVTFRWASFRVASWRQSTGYRHHTARCANLPAAIANALSI